MTAFVASALRAVLLPLFALCAVTAFGETAPPCEMLVKDGPHGLQWKCNLTLGENCTSCTTDGTCQQVINEVGNVRLHMCTCRPDGGVSKPDDCYTIIAFNLTTGLAVIDCENECCIELTTPRCKDPNPVPAYPNWTDPCPCK